MTYVDWELAGNPYELGSIFCQLCNAGGMWLANVDGVSAEFINGLEVWFEHVWMLVVFCIDVLTDC